MLKPCIFLTITFGLAGCENNNSNQDAVLNQLKRQEALQAEAKATCRRNMGSCSLSDTCSSGLQINVVGRTTPDNSRDTENCESRWNAATSRERGAVQCEKLTSKMLYDECVRDLR